MAAGDSYGASLSGSSSSGANTTATDSFTGGVALGPAYGAGSVQTNQPTASSASWFGIAIVLAAVAAIIYAVTAYKKG